MAQSIKDMCALIVKQSNEDTVINGIEDVCNEYVFDSNGRGLEEEPIVKQ